MNLDEFLAPNQADFGETAPRRVVKKTPPKTPLEAATAMMVQIGYCIVGFPEMLSGSAALPGIILTNWAGRSFDPPYQLRLTEPGTRGEWDAQVKLLGTKTTSSKEDLEGAEFWRAVLEKSA